jgi:hypothetical protein
VKTVRPLLQQGNGKLGSAIHLWSLPAGKTCPGKTEVCNRHCYAQQSRFLIQSVKERLEWNLAQITRTDYVPRMVNEIRRKGVLVVRIHVSGDFASAEYAAKWLEIIRQCPKVRFYGYSRSWRIPEIAAVLEQMAALKNVRLWYSLDSQTGLPERVPVGVRLCYLQVTEDEQPELWDLVFRVRRLRRRIPLAMTCPHETERGKEQGTTCGSCGKCWRD